MTESDLLSSSNSVSSDPDMDSIWTAELEKLERVEDAPDARRVHPQRPIGQQRGRVHTKAYGRATRLPPLEHAPRAHKKPGVRVAGLVWDPMA